MMRNTESTETDAAQVVATLRRSVFLIAMPFIILSLLLPVCGRGIGASVVEIGIRWSRPRWRT